MHIMETSALNEAQMSILRLLGSMKSVEEVNELRQVICDYYARRVDNAMDRLWEEGKLDNEKTRPFCKNIFVHHTTMPDKRKIMGKGRAFLTFYVSSKCQLFCFSRDLFVTLQL